MSICTSKSFTGQEIGARYAGEIQVQVQVQEKKSRSRSRSRSRSSHRDCTGPGTCNCTICTDLRRRRPIVLREKDLGRPFLACTQEMGISCKRNTLGHLRGH